MERYGKDTENRLPGNDRSYHIKARYAPKTDGLPRKLVTPQTPWFLGYGVETLRQSLSEAEKNDIPNPFQTNPSHFWIGTNRKWHQDKLHSHDYMQIFYVLEGSMRIQFQEREYILEQGGLMIIPPFFTHLINTKSTDRVLFYQCEFAEHFINPDAQKNGNTLFKQLYLEPVLLQAVRMSPKTAFNMAETIRIENIFHDIMNEYHTGTTFSFTYIRLRITELLSIVIAEYEKTAAYQTDLPLSGCRSVITRALAYMSGNYQENIIRQEVCNYAKMSVSSFSHIFKQVMGMTFVEHVNYLRVHQAQRLLTGTEKPLVDICYECGFCDGAYFSNIFKKYTSCTPLAYRNLYKKTTANNG